MAEEKKKKGFWSWLGFGKKDEQEMPVEPTVSEEPDTVVANDIRPEETAEQAVEIEEISATTEVEQKETTISEEPTESRSELQLAPTHTENQVETVGVNDIHPDETTEQAVEIEEISASTEIEPSESRGELQFAQTNAENQPETVGTNDIVPEETTEQAVEIEEISANTEIEPSESRGELQFAPTNTENQAETVGANNIRPEETTEIEEISANAEIEPSESRGELQFASTNTENQAETVGSNNIRPEETTEQAVEIEEISAKSTEAETQEKPSEGGFFSRLIKGLIKTKQNIGSGFRNLFRGKKIDDELFEELEEQLLIADLGMPTTTKIIKNLTEHATKAQLRDAELLYQQLKIELGEVLKPVAQPLVVEPKKPYVILMVGVNGVGKTTTIGKLARKFQAEDKSVMLAAGDTFRAAAVEQLQVWGERNGIPVVAQATGSDSASVIFDAMQSAAAKGVDVLIADTAGRLQNKNNLMDELKKIVRVMKKYDESAPHEIMLTLDAGTGQNAISQAKLFNEAVGLTGITLTKLDGTAKGGVIFAIADQFNIPIRFIGVGEKIDDLRPFNAEEFIDALFSHEDEKS